ncbi:MAG TPA: helix-turn-helix transcriptional regulator [Acidimicrobiales bacterium]|nr:helix-turn-helix transcriptional regulator [Acidimicrobiales bacterium]
MSLVLEDRLLRTRPLAEVDTAALVRQARAFAGLTQATLADALDTTQSAVSRWESGREEPRRARLAEILEICGLRASLVVSRLQPDDDVDRAQLRQQLAMSPEQRLASVANVSRVRSSARRA